MNGGEIIKNVYEALLGEQKAQIFFEQAQNLGVQLTENGFCDANGQVYAPSNIESAVLSNYHTNLKNQALLEYGIQIDLNTNQLVTLDGSPLSQDAIQLAGQISAEVNALTTDEVTRNALQNGYTKVLPNEFIWYNNQQVSFPSGGWYKISKDGLYQLNNSTMYLSTCFDQPNATWDINLLRQRAKQAQDQQETQQEQIPQEQQDSTLAPQEQQRELQ